jgi:hypothetical protein
VGWLLSEPMSDVVLVLCLGVNILTLLRVVRLEQRLQDLPCERGRRTLSSPASCSIIPLP